MKKPSKDDSSSSEDESNLQALREAVDENFLNIFSAEQEKKKAGEDTKVTKIYGDPVLEAGLEEQQLYQGLSQSCRDFIAKKLNKRLNLELELDEKDEDKMEILLTEEDTGIKLFKTSTIVLSKFEDPVETESFQKKKRKKPTIKFDEKKNALKCKEVAVSAESILSQNDMKHWTLRKSGKEFRYKKLKNGTLTELVN